MLRIWLDLGASHRFFFFFFPHLASAHLPNIAKFMNRPHMLWPNDSMNLIKNNFYFAYIN